MKHRVGFAVYKVMGSVNVQLAEKTGFSQEECGRVKRSIKNIVLKMMHLRQDQKGSMEVRRIYWWQHDEKNTGNFQWKDSERIYN